MTSRNTCHNATYLCAHTKGRRATKTLHIDGHTITVAMVRELMWSVSIASLDSGT